jgi:Glycosyltransferase
MNKTIGIYISNYNLIGGVERFVENFCKRMSKYYKITLLFDFVEDNSLLFSISEFVDVQKIDKDGIHKFDYFINSTAWGYSPYKNIEAEKVIQIIHADYRHVISNWNFKYIKDPKTTHHVCVGKIVKEAFEEATPYKCDAIIYNLLDNNIKVLKKPKNNILNLITCSRLSGEKGFGRMLDFAKLLENNRIDYVWNVYGSTKGQFAARVISTFKNNPKVVFNGITREPFKEINKADYLVQLSDTEGFAYSVYEAMQVKTPCIITPFASGNEQIKNNINGYIVPFDLKDIDLQKIVSNIPVVPTFEELGKEADWINLLEK